MPDVDGQWPPVPLPFAKKPAEKSDPSTCPSCGRKLLTLASVLCNWCGAVIENEEYQQKAAEARAAQDAAERERLDAEISETARHGVLGRLKQRGKELKRNPDRITDMLVVQELGHRPDKEEK